MCTDRQKEMLDAFIAYELTAKQDNANHNLIGVPVGTRLQRILKYPDKWRLWIATNDFIYGTYLELYHNGTVIRVTTRADEGDEIIMVRPRDEDIRT